MMRVLKTMIVATATAGLSACSSGYGTTPTTGGHGGGGPVGSVAVGPGIEFVSGHNGSANPSVDTIAVGGTVTWSWSGSDPHSVQSIGSPSFTSSSIQSGNKTYAVTFAAPGTYRYDCAVHGQAMTGTVVVR
jgi:plastocyanin